jgi:pimeloyl-ACP methyl ester carboxylesterase
LPGKNDCYAQLADGLIKYGIATLRYDKRGTGEAYLYGRPEKSLIFSQYIDDAIQAIELLRRDGHFGKIIVAGHGEGAVVGMVAAAKAKADGFIALAGVGVPAWQTIKEQLEAMPIEDQATRTVQEQAWNRIISSLRAGKTVASVPDELQSLFRPSVQPYLISWFSYEPQAEMAKLRCPVQLIQGGNDRKVTPADTTALEKGHPGSKEVYIPLMNHVLKDVGPSEEDNYAAYSDPGYSLGSGLLGVINDFVKNLSGVDNSRSDKE